jgi:short-subunit dehydrogenase
MANRLAVITGASSGIGAEFARQLAARRFDLLLVARRAGRLSDLCAELSRRHPIQAESLSADLAVDSDVDRVAQRLHSAPNLAFLVNNAGFGTKGLFWDASIHGQEAMHRVHVMATMRLSHAALANMVERGAGNLVNVSSVSAFSLSAGGASYCATKAWMNSFTEGLAVDLAAAGSPVRVQALCPGFTLTEFHDVLGVSRGRVPSFLWMQPREIVEASIRGLEQRQVIVVPGRAYQFIRWLLWALPPSVRRMTAAQSGRLMRRLGGERTAKHLPPH